VEARKEANGFEEHPISATDSVFARPNS